MNIRCSSSTVRFLLLLFHFRVKIRPIFHEDLHTLRTKKNYHDRLRGEMCDRESKEAMFSLFMRRFFRNVYSNGIRLSNRLFFLFLVRSEPGIRGNDICRMLAVPSLSPFINTEESRVLFCSAVWCSSPTPNGFRFESAVNVWT